MNDTSFITHKMELHSLCSSHYQYFIQITIDTISDAAYLVPWIEWLMA